MPGQFTGQKYQAGSVEQVRQMSFSGYPHIHNEKIACYSEVRIDHSGGTGQQQRCGDGSSRPLNSVPESAYTLDGADVPETLFSPEPSVAAQSRLAGRGRELTGAPIPAHASSPAYKATRS